LPSNTLLPWGSAGALGLGLKNVPNGYIAVGWLFLQEQIKVIITAPNAGDA
jgi:hypothetical protein